MFLRIQQITVPDTGTILTKPEILLMELHFQAIKG
jgi:hypothetical protein